MTWDLRIFPFICLVPVLLTSAGCSFQATQSAYRSASGAATSAVPERETGQETLDLPTATATITTVTRATPTVPVVTSGTPTPENEAASAPLIQPYPYTTPLPPSVATELDGVYIRGVPFEGTPTPCRRCAPYRAEGGVWTLTLDRGVFRIMHDVTGFSGVGSFSVAGDQLTIFNDPNCHLEIGAYEWELDGRSLRLRPIKDTCAFGLRVKNLGAGSWLRQVGKEGQQIDPCQPPSLEAAVTGHWPAPDGCADEQASD